MRVVAVVPTYRNLQTLPDVVSGLVEAGFPVIVVDDGSCDGTSDWVERWRETHAECWLVRLGINRGKGAALEAGFEKARDLGFEFAVSVDSDGQHLIEDAVRLRAAARSNAVIIGARDEGAVGYPFRSRLGRRLWALGIRALTGVGIADPICGLRTYPLELTSRIRCVGGRFTWEEEFLVRLVWAGIAVESVPITTVYLPLEKRVSHYSLWDWVDSFRMFLWLACRRVFVLKSTGTLGVSTSTRDRSWRWLIGAACFVGGVFGALSPWWIACPVIAWLAWRLHASVIVGVTSALLASAASIALTPLGPLREPLLLLAVGCLAVLVTKSARFLDSN